MTMLFGNVKAIERVGHNDLRASEGDGGGEGITESCRLPESKSQLFYIDWGGNCRREWFAGVEKLLVLASFLTM
jgi:hypothetical protein